MLENRFGALPVFFCPLNRLRKPFIEPLKVWGLQSGGEQVVIVKVKQLTVAVAVPDPGSVFHDTESLQSFVKRHGLGLIY